MPRDQAPQQITLLRIGPHNSDGRAMTHPSHELVYVVRGTYRVQAGDAVFACPPGDVVYMPRGRAHRISCRRDGSVQVFLLWFDDDVLGGEAWTRRDANGRILVLLHWLRDHTPPADARDADLHRHLLGAILCELEDLRGKALHDRDPVQQAMEFLRKNHDHPALTLGEVCAVVGLRPSALTQRFRRATGRSPMAWLQSLRVEKALSLLASSKHSVLAVAQAVGFRSAEHLSRLLRRECGRSPRMLRGTPSGGSKRRTR